MKEKNQSIGDRLKALLQRRSSLATLSLFGVLIIISLIWKVPEWQSRGIKDAKDWEKAKYSEEFRAQLGLPPEPSK